MHELQYNDNVILRYKYIPIGGSGNALVPQNYRTQIFLVSDGKNYDLGWMDGKLDEEDIKARVAETLRVNQERQYGTQQQTFLRRELTPRRERGAVGKRLFGETYGRLHR